MGGAVGQASDIAIANERMQYYKKRLYEILAHTTGKTYEQIWNDSDRDFWMTASEAVVYGIIDKEFTGKNLI